MEGTVKQEEAKKDSQKCFFRFIHFMPFTSHFRSNFDRFCHHFRFLFFTLGNRNARIDRKSFHHRRIYISLAFFASSQRLAPETESPESEEKAIKSAFEMVRRSSYERTNLQIELNHFREFQTLSLRPKLSCAVFCRRFLGQKVHAPVDDAAIYRPPKSHRNHNLHKITRSFSFQMTFVSFYYHRFRASPY